jgi:transposase-like protein
MGTPVDTTEVFKQPVHCPRCDAAFYFTLRAIAENQRLMCPQCRMNINLSDDAHRPLVANVKETIRAISHQN